MSFGHIPPLYGGDDRTSRVDDEQWFAEDPAEESPSRSLVGHDHDGDAARHQAQHRASEKSTMALAEKMIEKLVQNAKISATGTGLQMSRKSTERMVERAGDRLQEQATVRLGERSGERLAERTGERILDGASELLTKRPTESMLDWSAERAIEKAAGDLAERSTERAIEGVAEHLAERSTEKTIDRAVQHLAEKATEKSLERTAEHLTQRSTKKAAQTSAERMIGHAGERTVERITEETGERALERFGNTFGRQTGTLERVFGVSSERIALHAGRGLLITLPALGGIFALYLFRPDMVRVQEERRKKAKAPTFLFVAAGLADILDSCLHFFIAYALFSRLGHSHLEVPEKLSFVCAIMST